MNDIKAYVCFSGDSPVDGCVLVFAPTRNKARSMVHSEISDDLYIYTKAWRVKEYDKFTNGKAQAFWSNDELPKDAPPFFKGIA